MASPRRRPRTVINIFMGWLRTANPITMGLLVYIAMFQWTAYYHWQSNDQTHPPTPEVRLTNDLRRMNVENAGSTDQNGKLYSHLKNDKIVHPITPWQPFSSETESVKVPFPIFQTSLSKSGTTSLFKYFRCGGIKSSHQYITKKAGERSTLTGECIEQNVLNGSPPFQGCGEYDVFTDTGVSLNIYCSAIGLTIEILLLVICSI